MCNRPFTCSHNKAVNAEKGPSHSGIGGDPKCHCPCVQEDTRGAKKSRHRQIAWMPSAEKQQTNTFLKYLTKCKQTTQAKTAALFQARLAASQMTTGMNV